MGEYKVVDADQLDADLTTLADAIRVKTGGVEPLSFPEGMATEVDAVYEAGKKAEYDAFWDAFQKNGERTEYIYAFRDWPQDALKPKYDVYPTNSLQMLSVINYPLSIPQIEEECGIKFDFSRCVNLNGLVLYSEIVDVGFVDTTACQNCQLMLAYGYGMQKASIKLRSDGTQTFSSAFAGSGKLTDLTITDGVIGADIDFRSPINLSAESILSVMEHLSDSASGKTVTFSLAAVNNAFETAEGAADGSASEEWLALVSEKSNWTISLV